ncbi:MULTISPECIES: hypothetical protein [unclassified Streptomyces]|uniref:hypothetical protein n=1 Tax=unclassified Streptomyces TaxID=2593676 RepID=UPI002E786070|nr:hypothetical protein [Streptomyces sp. JV184]MEE1743766.1 hypothetical protein [Streptomyces sp. JV184]
MFTKSLSKKRGVVGAVAVAAATAGMMLATAPAAQAAPGNCTISSESSLSSLCISGTGQHRIHAVLNPLDPRLPQRIILGNWAPVGQTSVASNPWGAGYVVSAWVDLVD